MRFLRGWSVVIAVLVVGSGCGSGPVDSEVSEPRLVNDYSFRWSAGPGVDLGSPGLAAVRAYTESGFRVDFDKSEGVVYPGFDAAVKDLVDPVFASEQPGDPLGIVGTMFIHVLRTAWDGDELSAVLCFGEYGLGRQQEDGGFISEKGPGTVRGTVVVVVPPPGQRPDQGSVSDRVTTGPEDRPGADMFGGWRVVADRAGSDDWIADIRGCSENKPEPVGPMPERGKQLLESRPVVAPPQPGWPRGRE